MRFGTGPGFQAPAGFAEIEMRQGIRWVLLQAGFIGRARLLVLLLFQKIVTGMLLKNFVVQKGIVLNRSHQMFLLLSAYYYYPVQSHKE